jgi:hypothetical protein
VHHRRQANAQLLAEPADEDLRLCRELRIGRRTLIACRVADDAGDVQSVVLHPRRHLVCILEHRHLVRLDVVHDDVEFPVGTRSDERRGRTADAEVRGDVAVSACGRPVSEQVPAGPLVRDEH